MGMTEMLDLGLSNAGSFKHGIDPITIPSDGDWIDSYDLYGGQRNQKLILTVLRIN